MEQNGLNLPSAIYLFMKVRQNGDEKKKALCFNSNNVQTGGKGAWTSNFYVGQP